MELWEKELGRKSKYLHYNLAGISVNYLLNLKLIISDFQMYSDSDKWNSMYLWNS